MTWATPEEVRKELGLSSDDVPDEDLTYYIGKADKDLLNELCVRNFDKVLVGDIDGVNTTFYTDIYPIADTNYDGTVTVSDVTVSTWGEEGSITTKAVVTVNTLYPEYGTIVLDSAPAATVDVVTMTYYSYPRQIIVEDIPRVAAVLAAYYYVRSEHLLLPQRWMHGAYRFEKGTPAENLKEYYDRELLILKGRMHKKTKHDEVTFLRGE